MEESSRRGDEVEERTPFERDLINRLAFASLNEQRRARRWNILFKLLLFVYLFTLLFLAAPGNLFGGKLTAGPHTAKVEINGPIADDAEANAESIIEALEAAFESEGAKAVVLRINSPGGSPVQSDYVYKAIKRLRREHEEVPVYAVIVDMGASGAYYIASAADAIYANESSVVGSIGVLMDGFGFVGAMEKLGVDRRLYTAGENKGFLDPFSSVDPDNIAHVQGILDSIHGQFIGAVKAGRGGRLVESPELFSGLIWTGAEAVDLGLVDGLGDVGYVARELADAEEVVDYTRRPDLFQRFADRVGVTLARLLTGQAVPVIR